MTNTSVPSAFFKGLKEGQHISRAPAVATSKTITMLRCVRWVMKEFGMSIEVKRANVVASTLMKLNLVKYDREGVKIRTDIEVSIQDHKIEKGLFELEKKVAEYAKVKSTKGLDHALEMMRKNQLNLPSHNDLRNEVVMSGHTVRINYLGVDAQSGKDVFGGILFRNNEAYVKTEPQTRMGYVLDHLENALHTKAREESRKKIGEYMLKFQEYDDGSSGIA